jgi:hypothetical protein
MRLLMSLAGVAGRSLLPIKSESTTALQRELHLDAAERWNDERRRESLGRNAFDLKSVDAT